MPVTGFYLKITKKLEEINEVVTALEKKRDQVSTTCYSHFNNSKDYTWEKKCEFLNLFEHMIFSFGKMGGSKLQYILIEGIQLSAEMLLASFFVMGHKIDYVSWV